jgi:predicted nicotinamide N-methyase
MTHKERVDCMKKSLALCDVFVNEETADLVLQINDKIQEKGKKIDLFTICRISEQNKEKYKKLKEKANQVKKKK